jgi:hypothetical protein
MKKIILSLAVLFTYSVSIRFMTSGLNQDDFNNIHFNTISSDVFKNYNSQVRSLDQFSDWAFVFGALVILLALLYFYYYNIKETNKYSLINKNLTLQLEKENLIQGVFLNKQKLNKDLNTSLKERLGKLYKLLDTIQEEVKNESAEFKDKIYNLRDLTYKTLCVINLNKTV